MERQDTEVMAHLVALEAVLRYVVQVLGLLRTYPFRLDEPAILTRLVELGYSDKGVAEIMERAGAVATGIPSQYLDFVNRH